MKLATRGVVDCDWQSKLTGERFCIAQFTSARQQSRRLHLICMFPTDPIRWIDEQDTLRCKLPRCGSPFVLIPGLLGLAFGLFVGSWPFLISAFFFWASAAADRQQASFLWFVLGAFALFGAVAFPLAAFAWQQSILLLRGQKEIVLDATSLRIITRAGPIWSTRRCRLAQLGGFRVEDPTGDGFQVRGGYSSLVAVFQNGRTLPLLRMYPDEIVCQLAEQLPDKIEQITGRRGSSRASKVRADKLELEVVAPDPMAIRARSAKPIGSNLTVDESGEELLIQVPRLGYRKSTSPAARLWIGGFVTGQIFFTSLLVPALLAGKVQGSPSAGWVIACVSTAISLGIVLNRLAAATRHGTIRVTGASLMFQESTLLGEHVAEWKLKSIEQVRVGVKTYKSDDGVTWSHYLEVQPDFHDPRLWFDNRDKSELEWMATQIGERLESARRSQTSDV